MPGVNGSAIGCEPIALDECIARLDEGGINLRSDDGVAAASALIGRLWANRDFLLDFVLDELKSNGQRQLSSNRYGAQALMVHRSPGRYFIRANFWPAEGDAVVQASGRTHFAYDVPHDHNFDFITVGYLGPGYRSQWYEYDYAAVDGYEGEAVELSEGELGQLHHGRILHYRAHRDIHMQLPPESLSVSVNIIPERPDVVWRDQYLFDLNRRNIASVQSMAPSEMFLRLAVHFAGEDGIDVAQDFARHHPSGRMRWSAWRALIAASETALERLHLLERAAADTNVIVSAHAKALLRGKQAVATLA